MRTNIIFFRIPYERALEFANKERITELLYPLFVHNIGALLHHPVNHHPAYRTNPAPNNPTSPVNSNSPYPPFPSYAANPAAQIPRSHDFNAHAHTSPLDYSRGPYPGELGRPQGQGGQIQMQGDPGRGGSHQHQYQQQHQQQQQQQQQQPQQQQQQQQQRAPVYS
jgi:hypothetical protein